MLNTNELLFINACAIQGINHHESPENETQRILTRYLMQLAMGEDYTFSENVCRDFIKTEMANRGIESWQL